MPPDHCLEQPGGIIDQVVLWLAGDAGMMRIEAFVMWFPKWLHFLDPGYVQGEAFVSADQNFLQTVVQTCSATAGSTFVEGAADPFRKRFSRFSRCVSSHFYGAKHLYYIVAVAPKFHVAFNLGGISLHRTNYGDILMVPDLPK